MKHILYQLGPQTYSTQFENSFLGHGCRKKVAILWLSIFKSTPEDSVTLRETLKSWKLAECPSAWLTEAYTEQSKQLIAKNSILAHKQSHLGGKAELNNSYRIRCDKLIKIQADSNPLPKLLWHSPSSFSQPVITKAEFALLTGCNPSLALLLVMVFPPQCLSLLF